MCYYDGILWGVGFDEVRKRVKSAEIRGVQPLLWDWDLLVAIGRKGCD